MDFEFVTQLFPDGTEVHAYDASGYDSFPTGGPPGSAVATATVTASTLKFEGLEEDKPYFAAAQVGGEWRSTKFVTSHIDKGVKGYVKHGVDASASRPPDYPSVEWHGSVEPENAVEGDTWIEGG